MRTIGFFITVILLCSLFRHHEMMEGRTRLPGKQNFTSGFKIPFNSFSYSLKQTKKPDNNIDTAQLKQTGWYANVINSIRESEYEIKPAAGVREFASPNRQQDSADSLYD
jgi:hypothetical protein